MASEAAERAASEVKKEFALFDTAKEISSASMNLQAAQIHINAFNVDETLKSYYLVQIALVRLIEFPSKISDQDRESLGVILKDIDRAVKRFSTSKAKGTDLPSTDQSIAFNQGLVLSMERVSARVSRAI